MIDVVTESHPLFRARAFTTTFDAPLGRIRSPESVVDLLRPSTSSPFHPEIVRLLLAAGADAGIRDSKHDGDAVGRAEHFGQPEVVRILGSTGRNR